MLVEDVVPNPEASGRDRFVGIEFLVDGNIRQELWLTIW